MIMSQKPKLVNQNVFVIDDFKIQGDWKSENVAIGVGLSQKHNLHIGDSIILESQNHYCQIFLTYYKLIMSEKFDNILNECLFVKESLIKLLTFNWISFETK